MSFFTMVVSLIAVVPIAAMIVITSTIAMSLKIMWCKVVPIPVVIYKIDTLATSMILVTMPTPILTMRQWYSQIYWFALNHYPFNYAWLTINYPWLRIRVVANVDSTIEAWLPNAHGNPYVGSYCWGGNRGKR